MRQQEQGHAENQAAAGKEASKDAENHEAAARRQTSKQVTTFCEIFLGPMEFNGGTWVAPKKRQ